MWDILVTSIIKEMNEHRLETMLHRLLLHLLTNAGQFDRITHNCSTKHKYHSQRLFLHNVCLNSGLRENPNCLRHSLGGFNIENAEIHIYDCLRLFFDT